MATTEEKPPKQAIQGYLAVKRIHYTLIQKKRTKRGKKKKIQIHVVKCHSTVTTAATNHKISCHIVVILLY